MSTGWTLKMRVLSDEDWRARPPRKWTHQTRTSTVAATASTCTTSVRPATAGDLLLGSGGRQSAFKSTSGAMLELYRWKKEWKRERERVTVVAGAHMDVVALATSISGREIKSMLTDR
jgi:hypothetical protein